MSALDARISMHAEESSSPGEERDRAADAAPRPAARCGDEGCGCGGGPNGTGLSGESDRPTSLLAMLGVALLLVLGTLLPLAKFALIVIGIVVVARWFAQSFMGS
jgi:hypothetical protein